MGSIKSREWLESYTLFLLTRVVFFRPRSEYSYFSANLRLKYSLKSSRKVFPFGNLQIDYQIHCLVSRHVSCYIVTTKLRLVLFYCLTG